MCKKIKIIEMVLALLVSHLVSKNKLKDYFLHIKEFKVVLNIQKKKIHLFIEISNIFLTLFFSFSIKNKKYLLQFQDIFVD